ncbi:MAG: ribosome small subunit-dependent GTPase A [Acidimicrobiia bacterium]
MSATSALEPFGWSDRVAALMAGEPHPARVVRVDRDRALVATAEGDAVALADLLPAVGDWVGLAPTERVDVPWRVEMVAPRWSEVRRTDPRSEGRAVESGQVLAANVDLVCSVTPLDRPLSANRIDRELALAWDAGAQPVVVLTKADRHADVVAAVADLRRRLVGVDIVVTAALAGLGVPEIVELLRPNRTAMLLGASGAGKSTLANALLGDEVLETGGVRESDSRGRHTTTSRHLVPVPSGGVLLDTPGVRSLGLLGAGEGVSAVFADLEELATRCKFSDCVHVSEPGCAVLASIAAGELDAGRLQSWRKLRREIAAAERRVDRSAQAKWNAEMKSFHRRIRKQHNRP